MSKGLIEQLPELRDLGFTATELQIRNEEDFSKNPLTEGIDIYCMHEFKGSFHMGNNKLWGNIGDNHIFGDLSEKLLRDHINYAKEYGIPRFVIHPGFVNILTSSKDAALDTVARRLENIYDEQVKICIENSDFRPDFTAYFNERLVVDSFDVDMLFKKSNIPLSLTVDIEHLYNTAIFKQFYEDFQPMYQDVYMGKMCKADADSKAQETLSEFVRNNPFETENIIKNFVKDYFEKWNDYVELIHVCGSDPCNYRSRQHGGLTLLGSHLPLGFSGRLEGSYVKDRVDHKFYDSIAKPDVPVVVEIQDKNLPGGYVNWVAKSRDYLEGMLDM